MNDLFQEMRDIEGTFPGVIRAPPVIDQISANSGVDWATEFSKNHTDLNFTEIGKSESDVWAPANMPPPIHNPSPINWTNEFFANKEYEEQSRDLNMIPKAAEGLLSDQSEDRINYSEVGLIGNTFALHRGHILITKLFYLSLSLVYEIHEERKRWSSNN